MQASASCFSHVVAMKFSRQSYPHQLFAVSSMISHAIGGESR